MVVGAIAALTACGTIDDPGNQAAERSASEGEKLPIAARESLTASSQIAAAATADTPARRLGTSNSVTPPSAPPPTPPPTAGGPNTGHMLGASGLSPTMIGVDLATGRFRALDGNPGLTDLGVRRRDATIVTRRVRSTAADAVLTVDDCSEQRAETICVLYVDREGVVVDFFSLDGRFPGPAKTSYDGRYVAIDRGDRAAAASTLTVRDRDGTFIRSYNQTSRPDRRGAYDWMPDNRLVYSIEGNELLGDRQPTGIYVADPLGNASTRKITLPSYWQEGRIKTIESHPTDNTILINLEPRVGPTRPIIVDLDTLSVTQLIVRDDGNTIDTTNVVWGPNGEWVYVVVPTSKLLSGPGTAPGTTVVFIGSFDSLFAYRNDGTTHPMPLDFDDFSDSARIIPTDKPGDPGGTVGGGQYQGGLVWIPDA